MTLQEKAATACWQQDFRTDQAGHSVMHWIIKDRRGDTHNVLAPADLIYNEKDLRKLLVNHLAALPRDPAQALKLVQGEITRGPRIKQIGILTTKTGWRVDRNVRSYVLPAHTIGDQSLIHRDRLSGDLAPSPPVGSLKNWRKGLKKPCRASSHLTFCIALGFSAPTLRLSEKETGLLFNLAGPTGTGKTLVLQALQSMIGRAENTDLVSLDVTKAGLEGLCLRHNDRFLCLDEFGAALSTPKQATALILELAYGSREGRGRTRSAIGQKAVGYEHATWVTAVLTSSENSLDRMMGSEKREAGSQMRYVDLFVPARAEGGVFATQQTKPGAIGRDALFKTTGTTIKANYGHAFPKFVRKLVEDKEAGRTLHRYFKDFFDVLTKRASGHQQRYLEAFAKVYAAGRLAAELKIAPFSSAVLTDSVLALFDGATLEKTNAEVDFDTELKALIGLGEDPVRCPRIQKGGKAGVGAEAVRVVKNGTEYLFIPNATWERLFSKAAGVAVLDEMANRRITSAKSHQMTVAGLIAGSNRPRGIRLPWHELCQLGLPP